MKYNERFVFAFISDSLHWIISSSCCIKWFKVTVIFPRHTIFELWHHVEWFCRKLTVDFESETKRVKLNMELIRFFAC